MPAQTIVIPAGMGYDVFRALMERATQVASMQQYRAAANLQELASKIDEAA